jgi:hypothetical protein
MKSPHSTFLSKLLKTEAEAPRILVEMQWSYHNQPTTLYCSTERFTIENYYDFKEYVLNFGSLSTSIEESSYLAPPNTFSFTLMRNSDTENLLNSYQKNQKVIVKQWFKSLTKYEQALDLGTFIMTVSDISLSSFSVNCVSDESKISTDFPKTLINSTDYPNAFKDNLDEDVYLPCVLGKLWSPWDTDDTKRYLDCYLPNVAPAYCIDTENLKYLIHQVYGGNAEGINPTRCYQYYPDDGYKFYAYLTNYVPNLNPTNGGLSIDIDPVTTDEQGYARRLRLLPEIASSMTGPVAGENNIPDWRNACDLDYNSETTIKASTNKLVLGFNSRNQIARYAPSGLGYGYLGLGWNMRREFGSGGISKVRAYIDSGLPHGVYDFGVFESETGGTKYYEAMELPYVHFTKVYLYHSGVYEDETEDASNADTADVFHSATSSLLKNVGDILYLGMAERVTNCNIILSTVGIGGVIVWEYYKSQPGGGWIAFTPTSGAYHFTNITKQMNCGSLSGWTINSVNGFSAYWIRARVTTIFSTAPIGTELNIPQGRLSIGTNFDPADVKIALIWGNVPGYPIKVDGLHLIVDYYEDMGYALRRKYVFFPPYKSFRYIGLVRQPNGYVKTKINPDVKLNNVFGEIKGIADQSGNSWQTGHPVQIIYAILKSIAGLPSAELDALEMNSIYNDMGTVWEMGRFLDNPMNIKELLSDCLQNANLFLFRGMDNKYKIIRYNKSKTASDMSFSDSQFDVYLMKDFKWGYTDTFFNLYNLEFHWDANENEYREKYKQNYESDADLRTSYMGYNNIEVEYPNIESRWINSLVVMDLLYAELKKYWSKLKVWIEFETSLVGCLLELGDTIQVSHSAQTWNETDKKFQVISLEQDNNTVRIRAIEVIE